jgi:hypothetical protein
VSGRVFISRSFYVYVYMACVASPILKSKRLCLRRWGVGKQYKPSLVYTPHGLVLLAAGLALCYGESINLTWPHKQRVISARYGPSTVFCAVCCTSQR